MAKPFDMLNREEIYNGKIIKVVKDTVLMPNGKEAKREVVLHSAAAGIVPIDEDGNIILVKQYRYPLHKEIFEIPAGIVEEGEEPLSCAKRELEEETSYKADKFTLVTEMASSGGFCDEIIYIYIAEGLSKGEFNFDEDEFIEVFKFSVEEILDMIKNGEITDAKTLVGVLAYINKIK